MPTADNPRAGQFTLGFYRLEGAARRGDLSDFDQGCEHRLFSHWAGEGSIGLGMTTLVDLRERRAGSVARAGEAGAAASSTESRSADQFDRRRGPQDPHRNQDQLRVRGGSRIFGSASGWPPTSPWATRRSGRTSRRRRRQINSRRADWEWGAVADQEHLHGHGLLPAVRQARLRPAAGQPSAVRRRRRHPDPPHPPRHRRARPDDPGRRRLSRGGLLDAERRGPVLDRPDRVGRLRSDQHEPGHAPPRRLLPLAHRRHRRRDVRRPGPRCLLRPSSFPRPPRRPMVEEEVEPSRRAVAAGPGAPGRPRTRSTSTRGARG